LLAAEPDWFIENYLARDLESPTRKTTTDAIELKAIISEVQSQGRSITVEQMRVGACSIAYPVIVGGNVVAAVGLVIDATRQSEIGRLVPLLTATCRRIEASLATNIDAFI
jgi:DNA-binding IclR family transcriptional regulator